MSAGAYPPHAEPWGVQLGDGSYNEGTEEEGEDLEAGSPGS